MQEFSSYSSLSPAQFSQYYTLPPSYAPAGLPGSDDPGAGAGAGVAEYSAVKSEEAASAGLPPRGDSPAVIYPEYYLMSVLLFTPPSVLLTDASPPENLPTGASLPSSGARDRDELERRNSVGKSKGKAKKSDSSPPPDSDLEVTRFSSGSP